MLFKRSCGRIEDRRRDAHSVISEGYSESTKNKFLHYDFKSLDNYIKRYNWYATREMQDYIDYKRGEADTKIETDKAIQQQRKKKFGLYYKAPMFLRAWLWFLYNYVIRGGFLDGKVVDVKVVEELASIPPKEVLLGRMLGSLMGPLTGLAVGLQAVIDKANGGESAEAAPAEAEAPAAE